MGPSLQALAPKPVRGPVDSNAQGRTVARTRPTTNQHHSDAEWLKRKPIIERLLFVDHLKIKKAVQVLERDHGFKTGIRSLKTRLEQWGFNKNLSRDDMKILIARKDQRKCQGKDTTFTLHGHGIQPERLATFEKRYAKDYGPVPLSNAPTPDGVVYFTPRETRLEDAADSTGHHETLQVQEGPQRHKRVLDDTLEGNPQGHEYRDKRQRIQQFTGAGSLETTSSTDHATTAHIATQSAPDIASDHRQPLQDRGHDQNHSPVADALGRLYALFNDELGSACIKKQSIIRDMHTILLTSSRTMAFPRHAHETDPAVGLCSHHQTDSRLLQFQRLFGRNKVVLNKNSVQRICVASKCKSLDQVLTVDEIDFAEGLIQLQTLTASTKSEDLNKPTVVKTTSAMRFFPRRAMPTSQLKEPLLMLVASVLDQNGISISSLSVNTIRPAGSPVFQAVRRGDLQAFRLMLSLGEASVRDHDEYGASLLLYAHDQPELCKFLIGAGVDFDHLGCIDGIMGFLGRKRSSTALTLGRVDPDCSPDEIENINQCRHILLEAGADPTLPDSLGDTVFSRVLGYVSKASVSTVWNPSLTGIWLSISDYAVFSSACDYAEPHAIAELIRLGANVHARDQEARTALHHACRNARFTIWGSKRRGTAYLETIELFLKANVDMYSRDCEGFTAADLAYHWCANDWRTEWHGGSPGDIFDAALARCGFDIERFRRTSGQARKARYTDDYQRRDFERLWTGFEHLCPYWNDEPWPADLATAEFSSSEESEDAWCEPDSTSSSDEENNNDVDWQLDEVAANSDDERAVTASVGEGPDSASLWAMRPPELPSMLTELLEGDLPSDSEVEVIREIIPEYLIVEDAEELEFSFAGQA